ncbi:MAG: NAD(P)-dependent alcohol dehydrogenase [Actinomycetota bacterium]|nr:NAD(P)-dependent alcohol dehydrogenase [Actinomycetota bacterium]
MVYDHYGSPDDLELRDVPEPEPTDDEVLVRVRASSLNSWDRDLLVGNFMGRLGVTAPLRPRHHVLGADIAGVVERVGAGVDRFRPGDEVYGDVSAHRWGGFAEYVTAPQRLLAAKPASIDFGEAAALPQAGVLALQSLRLGVRPAPGARVLLIGAGGGVGTLGIQLAANDGAEVTAVDRADKLDALTALGAKHVVDHTVADPLDAEGRYDLIVDVVAHHRLRAYRAALAPGGSCALVGGATGLMLRAAIGGALPSRGSDRHVRLLVHRPNSDDLAELAAMIDAGDLRPVVDRRFPLADVPEAFRYYETGATVGKIVITLD